MEWKDGFRLRTHKLRGASLTQNHEMDNNLSRITGILRQTLRATFSLHLASIHALYGA